MSTCPDCHATYNGNAGHCRRCHHTFTSDTAFNLHLASKVHAGCLDPATVLTKTGTPKPAWNPTRRMWSCTGGGNPFTNSPRSGLGDDQTGAPTGAPL